jgi:hypothetical protein
MSTVSHPASTRSLYLELSALRIDVRTGQVPELRGVPGPAKEPSPASSPADGTQDGPRGEGG